MSKKLIRNSAAVSLGALILGIIILVMGGGGGLAYILLLLMLIVSAVAGGIAYFGALVKIARTRRMGWFVGVLLFGVIGALIYGLMGPEASVSNEAMGTFLARSYKQTKKTMGF